MGIYKNVYDYYANVISKTDKNGSLHVLTYDGNRNHITEDENGVINQNIENKSNICR